MCAPGEKDAEDMDQEEAAPPQSPQRAASPKPGPSPRADLVVEEAPLSEWEQFLGEHWAGIQLLTSRLQAVPYAPAFLAHLARSLQRMLANKVCSHMVHATSGGGGVEGHLSPPKVVVWSVALAMTA